ncbi:MAG TPA: HAMP domain-containing sensor histidine kinase [Gaiellaceae bacterium]|nr:HAMP domain-containing sensor histidine kinase [Gaiellaceae bacterium]
MRSVGGRLTLALLAVVACVLGVVYLILVPSYRSSLEKTEIASLKRSIRPLLERFPPPQYYFMQQTYAERNAPEVNARVIVFSITSLIPLELTSAADSDAEQPEGPVDDDPVAVAAYRSFGVASGIVSRGGQTYAEVAAPTQGQSQVLLLSASLHDQLQAVAVARRRMLIAGIAGACLAVALGYLGARLFTRRIRRLEAAAERIAAGDFEHPVVDHGGDELGQLARTFERMRLRLATLERARAEFIANASHELRTPLFSLGGFLELLDDPELDEPTREEFLGQMREQVERLTKLATDLLDLSRLDAGRLAVTMEPTDLAEVADELCTELGPRARAAGHELRNESEPGVLARGDAERVLQIGRILVDNALLHTPSGTTVRLRAATDGGRALLSVADNGPGIPPDARRQVFERFYRLDGTRASGSGLGLAIARELAQLMGGRILLEEEGGWTRFTLVLAVDAPDRTPAPAVFT